MVDFIPQIPGTFPQFHEAEGTQTRARGRTLRPQTPPPHLGISYESPPDPDTSSPTSTLQNQCQGAQSGPTFLQSEYYSYPDLITLLNKHRYRSKSTSAGDGSRPEELAESRPQVPWHPASTIKVPKAKQELDTGDIIGLESTEQPPESPLPSRGRKQSKSSKESSLSHPREIHQKIRDLISEPLPLPEPDSSRRAKVYIYAVTTQSPEPSSSLPIFKVGRSVQKWEKRGKQIRAKCGIGLQNIFLAELSNRRQVQRVESLIKLELRHFTTQPGCSCNLRGIPHEEYFRIPEQVILETARRWVAFMRQCPYATDSVGALRPSWKHCLNAQQGVSVEDRHDDHEKRHRRWNAFVYGNGSLNKIRWALCWGKTLDWKVWWRYWLLVDSVWLLWVTWPSKLWAIKILLTLVVKLY